MFYNAVNGTIPIDDTTMDYIAFGKGSKNLIMIPGLGEGLQTVGGTAIPFALLYRKLAKEFRVYMFSRRLVMPRGFTTRDMAEDIYRAMVHLNIPSANVLGVSLGGMIVQHLAIEHPAVVEKLILCVTLPYQNDTLVSCLTSWMDMARQGDVKGIMIDTLLKSNTKTSSALVTAYKLFGGLLPKKHIDRFCIMAQAGIDHNTKYTLQLISCPTLIIGGRLDQIVTGEASEQLHQLIPHSRLYMYEEYGHGLYEEAPDFWDRVADYFSKTTMMPVSIVYDEDYLSTDIIAVPDTIYNNIEQLAQQFTTWLYYESPHDDPTYWLTREGKEVCNCSTQGFVQWLNQQICTTEKAYIMDLNTPYLQENKIIEF